MYSQNLNSNINPPSNPTQSDNKILSFFKKLLNLEDSSNKPSLIFPPHPSSNSLMLSSISSPPSSTSPLITPFTIQEWETHFSTRSPSQLNPTRLLISLKSGIPPSLRGKIWMYLSGSFETYKKNKHSYQNLLIPSNPTAEEQITKDIPRTLLNKEKNKLIKLEYPDKVYNVLKAYANYDKEVGYCQGTNTIAATLLYCIGKEEFCFWTFCNLMQKNCWRDFFITDTPKLFRMVNVLQNRIKKNLKELYSYFIKIKLDEYLGIMITHYFLTLFTYDCPLSFSLRAIDLFWAYEEKVVFDIVVVLLRVKQEKLMKMEKEDILVYLKKDLLFDVVEEYGIDFIMNSI